MMHGSVMFARLQKFLVGQECSILLSAPFQQKQHAVCTQSTPASLKPAGPMATMNTSHYAEPFPSRGFSNNFPKLKVQIVREENKKAAIPGNPKKILND